MCKEYDFSKGVRGKHYEALKKGYTTIIYKSDGATIVKESCPIFLDEDVQNFFPNSESVNKALRGLIELVPNKK